jgi:hypothetical protein
MSDRTVFPSQAVLAIVILSLIAAAPAPGGERAKVRKPRLDLRATPRFSFTPSTVLVTAELNGGDDAEEFYYPAVVWEVSAWIMTSSARSEASSRRLVRGSVES